MFVTPMMTRMDGGRDPESQRGRAGHRTLRARQSPLSRSARMRLARFPVPTPPDLTPEFRAEDSVDDWVRADVRVTERH